MKQLLDYKCPHCGGQVKFDIGTQRMKCPHCDSDFSVYSFYTKPSEWSEADTKDIDFYTCSSCGGKLAVGKNDTAVDCPYCDGALVVSGKLSGKNRPDYIIPFETDYGLALRALKRYLARASHLPRAFKNKKHVFRVRGVYLPYYLFSGEMSAEPARYDSSLQASATVPFTRLPVDACRSVPNEITESIEPFDFKKAMPFSPSFLTRFGADVFDAGIDECTKRLATRMQKTVMGELTLEYTRKILGDVHNAKDRSAIEFPMREAVFTLKKTNEIHAFFPVWIVTTKWRDKKYMLAINGQTGKVAGNLPYTKLGIFLTALGIFAIGAVAALAISFIVLVIRGLI